MFVNPCQPLVDTLKVDCQQRLSMLESPLRLLCHSPRNRGNEVTFLPRQRASFLRCQLPPKKQRAIPKDSPSSV
jgi:hypothetical protein